MKKPYSLLSCALLIASVGIAEAQTGHAEANCSNLDVGPEKCELSWDMSSSSRTNYKVQALDSLELVWIDLAQASNVKDVGRKHVDSEALYRVLACDDRAFQLNCISSYTAWAPSLIRTDEIPRKMQMLEADGNIATVSVAKTADRYVQLTQYNVYLITDLVNRAEQASPNLIVDMQPPSEPENQVANSPRALDHQIMHNVQDVYQGARAQNKELRRRKSAD